MPPTSAPEGFVFRPSVRMPPSEPKRSISTTLRPRRAAAIAASGPVVPPPTTTMSASISTGISRAGSVTVFAFRVEVIVLASVASGAGGLHGPGPLGDLVAVPRGELGLRVADEDRARGAELLLHVGHAQYRDEIGVDLVH